MADEMENVTFVGGKAIEQNESLDSQVDDSVRADAEAAVREAIKGAAEEAKEDSGRSERDPFKPPGAKGTGEEDERSEAPKPRKKPAEPERGSDGKFLPSKEGSEDEEEEEIDPSKASLKQLLKNRDKLVSQKREAKSAVDAERQRLADETRKVQETWSQIQEMQREIARERAKLELFKKDPAAAIREIGYDPDQFIIDLAQEGTPEGQAAKAQRELQKQIEELRQWKEEQAQAFRRAQEEAVWQQQVQHREHIKKTFLSDALNEENRPHTSAFYAGREDALMAYADLIAQEYRKMSGGREASLPEVADFIEDELAERANRWYETKSGKQKVASPTKPPPGKGSKGKSLNPDALSERRSLGRKPLKELDDEERLAAARESVGLVLQDTDD